MCSSDLGASHARCSPAAREATQTAGCSGWNLPLERPENHAVKGRRQGGERERGRSRGLGEGWKLVDWETVNRRREKEGERGKGSGGGGRRRRRRTQEEEEEEV